LFQTLLLRTCRRLRLDCTLLLTELSLTQLPQSTRHLTSQTITTETKVRTELLRLTRLLEGSLHTLAVYVSLLLG
jgi:hypothetical protein